MPSVMIPLRSLLLLIVLLPAALPAAPVVCHAGVAPIAALASAVGGARVDARALLRPGETPEGFTPGPRRLLALAHSALYLLSGLPFERRWLDRLRQVNPRMRIVDLRGPGPDADDPHHWTDPIEAIRIASVIRDALTRIDPANADHYRRRFETERARWLALDRWIRERLGVHPGRHFLVFHPAWGHFARRYGLRQLAIEHEGKPGGARRLGELIERARRAGVRTVFVQPRFDRRLAERVAAALDARIVTIDPLAADQETELRRLVRALTEEES